jgi:hypothetical protein
MMLSCSYPSQNLGGRVVVVGGTVVVVGGTVVVGGSVVVVGGTVVVGGSVVVVGGTVVAAGLSPPQAAATADTIINPASTRPAVDSLAITLRRIRISS